MNSPRADWPGRAHASGRAQSFRDTGSGSPQGSFRPTAEQLPGVESVEPSSAMMISIGRCVCSSTLSDGDTQHLWSVKHRYNCRNKVLAVHRFTSLAMLPVRRGTPSNGSPIDRANRRRTAHDRIRPREVDLAHYENPGFQRIRVRFPIAATGPFRSSNSSICP